MIQQTSRSFILPNVCSFFQTFVHSSKRSLILPNVCSFFQTFLHSSKRCFILPSVFSLLQKFHQPQQSTPIHSLGSLHDVKSKNNCDGKDQYIMSPAPSQLNADNFQNPFKFSPCSVDYMRQYLGALSL